MSDPKIEQPTDAIIKVTSSGICGSDLHLYEVLGAFIDPGDVLGHEPMGVVEEVGSDVAHIKPGDRVVVPFNISCGTATHVRRACSPSARPRRCISTVRAPQLLGYTKLYGQVAGGQAEYLRVPQAHYGPIKVPDGPPDDRFVYLSDVLPTAWQAVEYANVPEGETLLVLGSARCGRWVGHTPNWVEDPPPPSEEQPMSRIKRIIGVKATKAAARHGAHGLSAKARREPLRAASLLSTGIALGLAAGWAAGHATSGKAS